MSELRNFIYRKKPGDIVNLTVLRNKKEYEFKINLSKYDWYRKDLKQRLWASCNQAGKNAKKVLKEKAEQGSKDKFEAVLDKTPNVEPEPYDKK